MCIQIIIQPGGKLIMIFFTIDECRLIINENNIQVIKWLEIKLKLVPNE